MLPKKNVLLCLCIFFPPCVYVGTLNLIASIPGPSILTFKRQDRDLLFNEYFRSYSMPTTGMLKVVKHTVVRMHKH